MPRAKSSTTMYELQESLQHFLTQGSLLLLESAGSVCETPRNNEGWVISDITKLISSKNGGEPNRERKGTKCLRVL